MAQSIMRLESKKRTYVSDRDQTTEGGILSSHPAFQVQSGTNMCWNIVYEGVTDGWAGVPSMWIELRWETERAD